MTYKDQFKPATHGLVINSIKELCDMEDMLLLTDDEIVDIEFDAMDIAQQAMIDMRCD